MKKFFCFCFLFFAIQTVYALPFSIVPQGALPTTVNTGETTTAVYNVKNTTGKIANVSFVKYLPPNVTQVTNEGGFCGRTFNLQPFGSTGDSCLLKLTISGAVNKNDPNPHHHLFVCRSDKTSCAGTNFPLNVTVVTPPPILFPIAYIAAQYFNDIVFCNLNQDGTFDNCATKRDTSFSFPLDVIASNIMLYVANSNNSISQCAKTAFGIFNTCSSFADPSFNLSLTGLRLNKNNSLLYVTNYGTNTLSICGIALNGTLTTCSQSAAIFNGPMGRIAFNSAGTMAYVANNANNTISICQLNVDGTINSCSSFSDPLIQEPSSLETDATGSFLFITGYNSGTSTVFTCTINTNGSLSNCVTNAGVGTFDFAHYLSSLFFKSNMTWIPSYNISNVSVCGVNANGTLQPCTTTAPDFPNFFPTSIWIDDIAPLSAHTFSYSALVFDGFINICNVTNTGSFSNCFTYGTGVFGDPNDIILDSTNTHAYVTDESPARIFSCSVSASGFLKSCQSFFRPLISNIFAAGLTLNPSETRLYFTRQTANNVIFCDIDLNGNLLTCTVAASLGGPGNVRGRIAFNADGSVAYVADRSNGLIYVCPVNLDGTFGACNSFADALITVPISVQANQTKTLLYIANAGATKSIVSCTILPDGSLTNCNNNTGGFSFNDYCNLFIDNVINYGFIPNSSLSNPTSISRCALNINGTLGACSANSLPYQSVTSAWLASFQ